MTPVHCRNRHDPENGKYGDCLRACVASVLDVDYDAVPHFFETNADVSTMTNGLRDYLATVGYAPFYVSYSGAVSRDDLLSMIGENAPNATYILFVGLAGGTDHAVVCQGGAVVHNPQWYPIPIVGPPSSGDWIVLLVTRA
jgi:hypothetical protein